MNELTITEYKDIRVLTTKQIAEAYEAEERRISENFNANKSRYEEGKHYIRLEGTELNEFLQSVNYVVQNPSKVRSLYLWTEKGAFLHAKSLNTDKAWEVYDKLVDTYFEKKKPLTAIEQIQLLSRASIELNDKVELVNKDLQNFKKTMPLLAIECQQITDAKNKKVVSIIGGKESNAYRNSSLRGRVYKDLEYQLRREFGVTSYKAIHRNQTDKAIEIIEAYELPLYLKEQVDNENSQIGMEDVEYVG